MSEQCIGFRQLDVPENIINDLYALGKIDIWDRRLAFYPNLYLELRNQNNIKSTVLGKIDYTGQYIYRVIPSKASNIVPRNREQVFALDALMDKNITVVVLTGTAGTGKTILSLAAALDFIQAKQYKRVIITRPMSEVGKYKLGALPGDASEKFSPYLLNYMTNLEQFVGNKKIVHDLIEQYHFEIVPLQLIRGASFKDSLVIADEMQVCTNLEVLTLGTRIAEGSKLVVMGDLNQRDEKIAKEKTGLYKLMNDKKVKDSPLTAAIELLKCERSETAKLFAKVFEE